MAVDGTYLHNRDYYVGDPPYDHYYRPYPSPQPWIYPKPIPRRRGTCPTCGRCLDCGGGHYCPGPYRPWDKP